MEELELVGDSGVLGDIKVDLGELAGLGLAKEGDCELGALDLGLKLTAGDLVCSGADLLEDPVDDLVLGSATVVLGLLTLPM